MQTSNLCRCQTRADVKLVQVWGESQHTIHLLQNLCRCQTCRWGVELSTLFICCATFADESGTQYIIHCYVACVMRGGAQYNVYMLRKWGWFIQSSPVIQIRGGTQGAILMCYIKHIPWQPSFTGSNSLWNEQRWYKPWYWHSFMPRPQGKMVWCLKPNVVRANEMVRWFIIT